MTPFMSDSLILCELFSLLFTIEQYELILDP